VSLLAKAAAGWMTFKNHRSTEVVELFDLNLARWKFENGEITTGVFLPTELGWRLLEDYHENIQEDPDHGDEPER
jgi:hypothetical protein